MITVKAVSRTRARTRRWRSARVRSRWASCGLQPARRRPGSWWRGRRAGRSGHGRWRARPAAGEEATTVAELKQAAPRWAALPAEYAGLALGYGEHQHDAARYPADRRPVHRRRGRPDGTGGLDRGRAPAGQRRGRPSPTRPVCCGAANRGISAGCPAGSLTRRWRRHHKVAPRGQPARRSGRPARRARPDLPN
jgi:hypothetical protein